MADLDINGLQAELQALRREREEVGARLRTTSTKPYYDGRGKGAHGGGRGFGDRLGPSVAPKYVSGGDGRGASWHPSGRQAPSNDRKAPYFSGRSFDDFRDSGSGPSRSRAAPPPRRAGRANVLGFLYDPERDDPRSAPAAPASRRTLSSVAVPKNRQNGDAAAEGGALLEDDAALTVELRKRADAADARAAGEATDATGDAMETDRPPSQSVDGDAAPSQEDGQGEAGDGAHTSSRKRAAPDVSVQPHQAEQQHQQKRAKRLFGSLLGTLQKFQQEDERFQTSMVAARRQEALRKAEERSAQESEALRIESQERRRAEVLRARELGLQESLKEMELTCAKRVQRHSELCDTQLLTEARPQLYWEPARHSRKTEEALHLQQDGLEAWKAGQLQRLEEDKAAFEARRRAAWEAADSRVAAKAAAEGAAAAPSAPKAIIHAPGDGPPRQAPKVVLRSHVVVTAPAGGEPAPGGDSRRLAPKILTGAAAAVLDDRGPRRRDGNDLQPPASHSGRHHHHHHQQQQQQSKQSRRSPDAMEDDNDAGASGAQPEEGELLAEDEEEARRREEEALRREAEAVEAEAAAIEAAGDDLELLLSAQDDAAAD